MSVLQTIADFDRKWLLLLQQSRGALALRARLISRSADGHLYGLILLAVALLGDAEHPFIFSAIAALFIERVVYWLMKNGLRRKRPAEALTDFQSRIIASDEFSFPSGHTSAAFLFVTLLTFHFGPLFMLLYPWALAVAMSRIYLGVHFPTDTAMGAVLGTGIAVITTAVMLP